MLDLMLVKMPHNVKYKYQLPFKKMLCCNSISLSLSLSCKVTVIVFCSMSISDTNPSSEANTMLPLVLSWSESFSSSRPSNELKLQSTGNIISYNQK